MDQCCAVSEVPRGQRRVLWAVLAVNAAMFLLEFGAGLLARSTALLADSVDMLGDALVYGFSLHVVARGPIWQARAAILKGVIMAGFGAGVLIEVVVKLTRGSVPIAEIMAPIGAVALVANATCLWLLWRRRADDLNMRSAWLCSRNDVVANVGVLLAAAGVAVTGAVWPDILTGLAIAALFVGSAVGVLLEAGRALRPGVHAH
jgi:cation diffusion facilitator family transporter